MSSSTPSNLYPSLSYDDAPAAIEALCTVLGFEKRLVVPGPDGTVRHSELTLGPGVVMVSTSRAEEKRLSPKSAGGNTAVFSIQCDDPDAVYERVKAAGWTIVREMYEEDYGSRGFLASDAEGHSWYVGTYRPGRWWDGAGGAE